jgi:hypothetical protein
MSRHVQESRCRFSIRSDFGKSATYTGGVRFTHNTVLVHREFLEQNVNRGPVVARDHVGIWHAPTLPHVNVTLEPSVNGQFGTADHCRLTVKLRGRPEAPDEAPRAHTVFSARGADTEAVHGPLQRLLDRTPKVKPYFSAWIQKVGGGPVFSGAKMVVRALHIIDDPSDSGC